MRLYEWQIELRDLPRQIALQETYFGTAIDQQARKRHAYLLVRKAELEQRVKDDAAEVQEMIANERYWLERSRQKNRRAQQEPPWLTPTGDGIVEPATKRLIDL